MSRFWERVDEELEYRGMTRKALAGEVGFSLGNIGKGIQLGSCPSAETAVSIARVLGVSVEYLVSGKNAGNSPRQKAYSVEVRHLADALEQMSPKRRRLAASLIKDIAKWEG